MNAKQLNSRVSWVGAMDWDRRLFDALIPLPDGTSYNSYLINGSDKTVLIDSVDPAMLTELLDKLDEVENIDYIVANHGEQDHSGSIPVVMGLYPEAVLITSSKGKSVMMDHLGVPEERIKVVEDGEELSLGDCTLKFIYTPWVHWPETMCTYLVEDGVLFSCDLFGAHVASSSIMVAGEDENLEAARRYYAEIMMPFATFVHKNVEKLKAYNISMICPSHGQVHIDPEVIMNAYDQWATDLPKDKVVIPYISMHDSTREMVDYLVGALADRNIEVEQFDLTVADIGKLASSLVDAATVVIATPTVLAGPHPLAAYSAFLANALRPKFKFATVIGSYGWGGKTVETLAGMLSTVKPELLEPVLVKGIPQEETMVALDALADVIADKHVQIGARQA